MYKYFLGLKYLIKRPINLLGAIGVMIAVWALVTVISVFSGFVREVRNQIRGTQPALSLLDDSLTTSYAEVEALLTSDSGVAAVAPRIAWHGLLFPKGSREHGHYTRIGESDLRSTDYFQIVGIDYAKERRVSRIDAWLENAAMQNGRKDPFVVPARLYRGNAGEFDKVPPGVLIGGDRIRGRASRDPSRVGQEITLASAFILPGGGVKSVRREFVLSGSYDSGRFFELEATTAFVDIEQIRAVFGHDADDPDSIDVFTEVGIAVRDEARMDEVAARLNKTLHDKGLPGAVVTWEQRQARFLGAVEHERGVMKVVLFVFLVVASFLIFAIVSMLVTKKTRDIGIVAALGGTRRGVLAVFLISGSVISVLGALLGLGLGWLTVVNLDAINDLLIKTTGASIFPTEIYGLTTIPHVLDPVWFAEVAAGAVGIALLFSFLPALRASRFDPVQALRYE